MFTRGLSGDALEGKGACVSGAVVGMSTGYKQRHGHGHGHANGHGHGMGRGRGRAGARAWAGEQVVEGESGPDGGPSNFQYWP